MIRVAYIRDFITYFCRNRCRSRTLVGPVTSARGLRRLNSGRSQPILRREFHQLTLIPAVERLPSEPLRRSTDRLPDPSHIIRRQTRATGSTLLPSPGTSKPLRQVFSGTALSACSAPLACTRPRSDISAWIRERPGISFQIPVVFDHTVLIGRFGGFVTADQAPGVRGLCAVYN